MAFRSLLWYFKKHSSPGKWMLVRLVIVLLLLARLPVVACMAISSWGKSQNGWSETMLQYARVVFSLLRVAD